MSSIIKQSKGPAINTTILDKTTIDMKNNISSYNILVQRIVSISIRPRTIYKEE